MNDESKRGMRMSPDQGRRVLPWLVAALVLLAAWLLVGGARPMQDQSRAVALEQARDNASGATQRAIGDETRRLAARLVAPEVRAALAVGDRAAAARAIGAGWTGLKRAEVWPAGLEAHL